MHFYAQVFRTPVSHFYGIGHLIELGQPVENWLKEPLLELKN